MFALNVASTPDRTASYSAEMDHLLTLLQDEMKKIGSNKINVSVREYVQSARMLSHVYAFGREYNHVY